MSGVPPLDAAVAAPFLRLFGIVLAAHLLARQTAIASTRLSRSDCDHGFLTAKIATAGFFVREMLPEAGALHKIILAGTADLLDELTEEQFCV